MLDFCNGTNVVECSEEDYIPGVPATRYTCSKRCKAFVSYMVSQDGTFKCAYCTKYGAILEKLDKPQEGPIHICTSCHKDILSLLYSEKERVKDGKDLERTV